MQKIVVFQQDGSGEAKIEGIRRFGGETFEVVPFNIDGVLPPLLDDTSDYLPETVEGDLVLDFLKHQDLSHDLSLLCGRLNIPLVASGKKINQGNAVCPPV